MDFKLSIIVPHYNSIKSLKRLLLSIPDKDDIQVVVIDDHSSDEVKSQYKKLRSKFNNKRYFFLENTSDIHNAGAARNIGLENAQGEWLLFADADDFFLEGFYCVVCKYFDKEYDLIYFKTNSIYSDTGKIAERHIHSNSKIDDYIANPCRQTEIRLRTRSYPPFAKLIRSSVVFNNNIRFEEVSVNNDQLFSVKVGYYAKKVSVSNDVIYCITRSSGTLTSKMDLASFETRASVAIKVNDFLKAHLSHQDFAYVGKFTAYEYLYKIIKMKYGIKIFLKYFKIFAQKGMFAFSIKGFRRGMIKSFFATNREEKLVKENYQSEDLKN